MSLWLIVNSDMYDAQWVVSGESMNDVAYENDLKYATLIVRLNDETVNAIKELSEDSDS